MTDFNYKKYSLENLENWVHDAMSSAEATPQEIYEVIRGVVEDNYLTSKQQASKAYELLALLNGNMNGKSHITKSTKELTDNASKQDKVVKWRLPIEPDPSGEYIITFPDDLLEAANLKEGDEVEWVEQEAGTFLLRKISGQKTYDEMIASGYTMTADGFWIKE
jgi:antitoxin component of MazEF toxin-antitoxin module